MAHSPEQEFSVLPALHLPGLTEHQALIVEFTWLTMAVIVVALIGAIITLKKVPGGFQNIVELLTSFIENYIVDIIGKKGLSYFPLVMTAFTFILTANYIGLIPGFLSPTASLNTTAAWALVVFVFYQYLGVSKKGLKYFKHFLGPVPAMAPFMVFIEIIGEFARPFSLSVRLFANIFCGEVIIKLLFGIFAIGLPVIWMFWDSLITIPLQAFIFSLLTMVYVGGAISTEEQH
ncbi:MAG TPA: F0F1 ATP synthase subunit A [Chitinivibrionales bacterium]